MTEDELLELEFIKRHVPVEESGDQFDYHYYTYALTPNINLVSTTNDESGKKNWKVSVDYWGEINNVDDISALINIFKNIDK